MLPDQLIDAEQQLAFTAGHGGARSAESIRGDDAEAPIQVVITFCL